ncbi:hypothetical protein ABZU76_01040 [Amycolatopsis sp. NPDC005232]|uniref:hypothetical protein n=1 Tax=Amycolatopsis sp. NPDC005232 TaxID=3157027 RepID=UPI0033AB2769
MSPRDRPIGGRPIGKRERRAAARAWPSARTAPADGEPWLPPGDNARPDGAWRVLAGLIRRTAWAVAGAVTCLGMFVGGGGLGVAQDWAAAETGARDVAVYDPAGPDTAYFPDAPHHPLEETIEYGLVVAGLIGSFTSAGFAVRGWRRRRAVVRTGWRAATLDFGEPGVTRATFADGTKPRLRPSRGLSREYALLRAGQDAGEYGFLAGEGNRMVLFVPGAEAVSMQAVSTRWT